jgi:hypothetical protein
LNAAPSLFFGIIKWVKGGIYSSRIEKRLNMDKISEKEIK